MGLAFEMTHENSRLKSLVDHFSAIQNPRQPWRVAHPLSKVLLPVVGGTMADCDDFDGVAECDEVHLASLCRYLPYSHDVPGGRWLTLLMNRMDPGLFSAAFTAWVSQTWFERPDFVVIDGKTSRLSHDRASAKAALHLVSAFATTSRLALGQEAVGGKANELAIPVLIDRLAQRNSFKGALVSIAANAKIAEESADADYLFAVKANQPTLLAEIKSTFVEATRLDEFIDHDKGHGRTEQWAAGAIMNVDWLEAGRRLPGEFRLPHAACIVRACSRKELSDRSRFETRYNILLRLLTAQAAYEAVRDHCGIENHVHWVPDVASLKTRPAYARATEPKNMAIVRHFALNLFRAAPNKRTLKRRKKLRAATQTISHNAPALDPVNPDSDPCIEP